MLTLYVKTGCPYCAKVLDAGKELELTFNEKNIADEGVMDELMAIGGEDQVPFLIDDEGPIEMYESDAIVTYLHHTFGKDGVSLSKENSSETHGSANVCTISDD